MMNRYVISGIGVGLAGAGATAVSIYGLVAVIGGALLIAFGLGYDRGLRQLRLEERLELDRLFEESLQHGRLATFVEIPESAFREMAAFGAERFKVSGPLERPDLPADATDPPEPAAGASSPSQPDLGHAQGLAAPDRPR